MARSAHTLAVAFFLFSLSSLAALSAAQRSDEWLQGSGQGLRLRLHGEVVDADGRPATGPQVACNMNSAIAPQALKASVEGNRFKIWIPVNQPNGGRIQLRASSGDNDRVAYATLDRFQLRQGAIDGLKLKLESPTRRVNVKVTYDGEPVSGATVNAVGVGIELRSTTGADGVAKFALLRKQELYQLTAWTDDHRIAGFQFGQSPPRDPDSDEHDMELSKCRDQIVRFVREDGSPAPGVKFGLQIATPQYNYIGEAEPFEMTTDAAGEAVCRWFPDWKEVHYYPEINETNRILEGDRKVVDGVAIYMLKEHKPKTRKRISGRVISKETLPGPGGHYISMKSFQGERENHGDHVSAFSDPDGRFVVDVLPDATYCAYVQDEKWVSKTLDLVPYQSALNKVTNPEFEVVEGQPVEVIATSGHKKVPIPDLTLRFSREHRYSWHENGELRSGTQRPSWWTTTDESGKATARTLPGKLEVSVYTPRWRTQKTIDVIAGKPAQIELHREIDEKRTVTGQIVLDADDQKSLEGTEVRVFSLDGNYNDDQSLTCKPDGSFAFSTFAAEVGIFAITRDGKAAGSLITKKLDLPIQLRLDPTAEYRGQLLALSAVPAVSHPIRARVHLEVKRENESRSRAFFDVKRIVTKTDQRGEYTLAGIPTRMNVIIEADALDGSDNAVHLDEVYLEPNETRPRVIKRLTRSEPANPKLPLADRYRITLRDCALGGYRLMLILADDSESTMKFVDRYYLDYDTNKDVYSFMQLVVLGGKKPLDPADEAFLKERRWPLPPSGRIFACAIDAGGQEIGQQEIDLSETEAAQKVAEFIHQHAPAPDNAEEKWTAAFAEASRTDKRVWARVSQRYCGPCITMSRWLDDQRAVIEKDYVMLKIDDARDINGKEVAERLFRGQELGIPFHAIFESSGTMLIDSNGPLGNISHPSGVEGKKHLRKMLLDTRKNLSEAEIEQVVESTEE